MGTIVNSDLQTKVDGLVVCDASVLPTAPRLPPILTMVALAKRLAATPRTGDAGSVMTEPARGRASMVTSVLSRSVSRTPISRP